MYSYDDLFIFVKVVEIGSFINTAKLLKVSHTTISRRIRELEHALGIKLLRVDSKNLIPTEQGLKLYQELQNQAKTIDEIISQIITQKTEPKGTLNVILPIVMPYEIITPHIPQFLRQNPDINLNLCYHWSSDTGLIKKGIDIAITTSVPSQQTPKIKKIFTDHVKLYCTKKYAEKYGIPETPWQLPDHLVTGRFFENHTVPKNLPITNLKTGETLIVPMPRHLTTDNTWHNYKLILSDEIIGAILDSISYMALKNKLVPVLPNYTLLPVSYYLVRHPQENDNKITLFCTFLENCFKRMTTTN